MHKLLRITISLIGASIGFGLVLLLNELQLIQLEGSSLRPVFLIAASIAGFVVFYLMLPMIGKAVRRLIDRLEQRLENVPTADVVFGTLGLIIGLVIAFFASQPLQSLTLPYIGNALGVFLSILIYIGLGLLGLRLAIKNKDEVLLYPGRIRANAIEKPNRRSKKKDTHSKLEWQEIETGRVPKILDTSVIIDGRILEIVRAGFLEGPLIISVFVLEELQHIADSSDDLRRERGRRGLDIVNQMQMMEGIDIVITEEKFEQIRDVDSKLLKLTQSMEGKIVTNDYNLNKVASVQNIPVLNVNDLANAVKPVVIPGEEMKVQVIKEGKEFNQGLAYLEDGTMIVVENGKRVIGKSVTVVVTSVLQTAAGKMIFAKLK